MHSEYNNIIFFVNMKWEVKKFCECFIYNLLKTIPKYFDALSISLPCGL